jgi:fibronectin-binding autotransporter adhesin
VSGTFGATATGAITQTGALNVTGASTINAGTNAITLANAGNNFIGVVNLTGGATSIRDANLLTLGTLNTGALTVHEPRRAEPGQRRAASLMRHQQRRAITQTGALTVAGASTVNAGAGNITLTNAGNNFNGALSLTGGKTTIMDANALTLGTLNTAR